MTMDIDAIQKILPHRYPFLLVDRVVELDKEKKTMAAIKNVTVNEPFFQGHFPGFPCMPGVLQIEIMAQVGGLLMGSLFDIEGRIAYFLAIDKARFRRVVRPGDVLRIEVKLGKARLKVSRMSARITVDGELAAEADLMFAYREE